MCWVCTVLEGWLRNIIHARFTKRASEFKQIQTRKRKNKAGVILMRRLQKMEQKKEMKLVRFCQTGGRINRWPEEGWAVVLVKITAWDPYGLTPPPPSLHNNRQQRSGLRPISLCWDISRPPAGFGRRSRTTFSKPTRLLRRADRHEAVYWIKSFIRTQWFNKHERLCVWVHWVFTKCTFL